MMTRLAAAVIISITLYVAVDKAVVRIELALKHHAISSAMPHQCPSLGRGRILQVSEEMQR